MASNDFYGASLGQNISPQPQNVTAVQQPIELQPQHVHTQQPAVHEEIQSQYGYVQPTVQHQEAQQQQHWHADPPKSPGEHPQHIAEPQPPYYSQDPSPQPQYQQTPAPQPQDQQQAKYYTAPQGPQGPQVEQRFYGQGQPVQHVVVVKDSSKDDQAMGFCLGCMTACCCCGCTVM